MLERIQKILSKRGVCSRREAEELLSRGQILLNGKAAKIGDKADAEADSIEISKEALKGKKKLYYVLHKPIGVLSENVPGKPGLPTVYDLLPGDLKGVIAPVGRLDKESSGLLIFTDDGVVARRLIDPEFDHEKEYEVVLDRSIDPLSIMKIAHGVMLDGRMTKAADVRKVRSNAVRIILREGRNRQIRRVFQQVGYTVKSLERIRIVTLEDRRLVSGDLRALTQEERLALLTHLGVQ